MRYCCQGTLLKDTDIKLGDVAQTCSAGAWARCYCPPGSANSNAGCVMSATSIPGKEPQSDTTRCSGSGGNAANGCCVIKDSNNLVIDCKDEAQSECDEKTSEFRGYQCTKISECNPFVSCCVKDQTVCTFPITGGCEKLGVGFSMETGFDKCKNTKTDCSTSLTTCGGGLITTSCTCGGAPAQVGKYCCGDATKTISDSECTIPLGSCAESDTNPISSACICEGSPRNPYSGYCCSSEKTKGMFKLTKAECTDGYSAIYGCPDGYRDNGYTQCDGKTDGTAFCDGTVAFYCKSSTQANGQVVMKTCNKNCGSYCVDNYNYCQPADADKTAFCGDGVRQSWEECDYAIQAFGQGFAWKCVGDGKYIGCVNSNPGILPKCTYTDTSSDRKSVV
jgi:hypothetical protein